MARENGRLDEIRASYLDMLMEGDAAAASRIVEQSVDEGYRAPKIYLEILVPAQIHLGAYWKSGRLHIAQEHLATEITKRQMDWLRSRFHPRASIKYHVMVTAVQGDFHDIGPRMVADFFYWDGWMVDYLGANTPTEDLVRFVEQRHPDLVGVSATLPEHLIAAGQAMDTLRRLSPRPCVLLGGAAVKQAPDRAEALGPDAVVTDAVDAVRKARQLLGLSGASGVLERYLKDLGLRIQTLRKARRWNQQQLADAADLDRTYISAVEHGKQNITLGAVIRLAEALDEPFEALLVEGAGEVYR